MQSKTVIKLWLVEHPNYITVRERGDSQEDAVFNAAKTWGVSFKEVAFIARAVLIGKFGRYLCKKCKAEIWAETPKDYCTRCLEQAAARADRYTAREDPRHKKIQAWQEKKYSQSH